MDVGPISAIRPVTMIKPSSAAPDLSRVFEAEYLGQSKDDEYASARRPQRGLEDEEEGEQETAETEAPHVESSSSRVSFFA